MSSLDVLILANGEPPPLSLLQHHLRRASTFIALDGAANGLVALGLRPDVIIGDLDSYDRSSFPDLEPIYDPDQETNDLEKGLQYAVNQGATSALVLGATGRRLDHTLKNLSVWRQFHDQLEVTFEDAYAVMRLMTEASPVLELEGEPGQGVSLFPLSGRVEGVLTEGLAWPLDSEPLENGVRDGTSNALLGNRASISLVRGDLLVFLNHPSSSHPLDRS